MSDTSEARKSALEDREDGSPDVEDKLSAELADHEDDEEEDTSLLDTALGDTTDDQEAGLNLLDESADAETIEDPVRKLCDSRMHRKACVFYLKSTFVLPSLDSRVGLYYL